MLMLSYFTWFWWSWGWWLLGNWETTREGRMIFYSSSLVYPAKRYLSLQLIQIQIQISINQWIYVTRDEIEKCLVLFIIDQSHETWVSEFTIHACNHKYVRVRVNFKRCYKREHFLQNLFYQYLLNAKSTLEYKFNGWLRVSRTYWFGML